MPTNRKGAYNLTAMIAAKADHSGIVQVDSDMKPTVNAATLAAHIALTFNQKFSTGNNIQGKQITLEVDSDQFGKKVLEGIDNFKTAGNSEDTGDPARYENGVASPTLSSTVGTSGSTENDAVFINYVNTDTDDPTKVIVYIFVGNFSEDSGSFTTNDTDAIKPKKTIISKPAAANIAIPAEMFDSTIVNVAAPVTLVKSSDRNGLHYQRFYLTKAA